MKKTLTLILLILNMTLAILAQTHAELFKETEGQTWTKTLMNIEAPEGNYQALPASNRWLVKVYKTTDNIVNPLNTNKLTTSDDIECNNATPLLYISTTTNIMSQAVTIFYDTDVNDLVTTGDKYYLRIFNATTKAVSTKYIEFSNANIKVAADAGTVTWTTSPWNPAGWISYTKPVVTPVNFSPSTTVDYCYRTYKWDVQTANVYTSYKLYEAEGSSVSAVNLITPANEVDTFDSDDFNNFNTRTHFEKDVTKPRHLNTYYSWTIVGYIGTQAFIANNQTILTYQTESISFARASRTGNFELTSNRDIETDFDDPPWGYGFSDLPQMRIIEIPTSISVGTKIKIGALNYYAYDPDNFPKPFGNPLWFGTGYKLEHMYPSNHILDGYISLKYPANAPAPVEMWWSCTTENNTEKPWVELGYTTSDNNIHFSLPTGHNTYSGSNVKEYYFVIKYYNTIPTPVELTTFTALFQADFKVNVNWTTESESSVLGFNIYRGFNNTFSEADKVNTEIVQATNTTLTHNYEFQDMTILPQTTYYYWLESVDYDGTSQNYGPLEVKTGEVPIPDVNRTWLGNAGPNPFLAGTTTTIPFGVKKGKTGTLSIFNIKGQIVKSITVGTNIEQKISWNGKDTKGKICPNGVYFYSLKAGKDVITKKVLLLN